MGRVVVTGGAGFLASHRCGRLLDDGCDVLAQDDLLREEPRVPVAEGMARTVAWFREQQLEPAA